MSNEPFNPALPDRLSTRDELLLATGASIAGWTQHNRETRMLLPVETEAGEFLDLCLDPLQLLLLFDLENGLSLS